jgi:hypothetical protein
MGQEDALLFPSKQLMIRRFGELYQLGPVTLTSDPISIVCTTDNDPVVDCEE